MDEKTDTQQLNPLATARVPSCFSNAIHIISSPTCVRIVFGEQVGNFPPDPRVAIALSIPDAIGFAKRLSEMVNHYLQEQRNASRVIVPGAGEKSLA